MTGRPAAFVRWASIFPAAVAVFLTGAVRPQDIPAARACAGIVQNTARLACYDAALGVGARPPEARFGDDGRLSGELAPKVDEPKSVTAAVQSAVALPGGLYRVTLDNGQVWRTLEADWALAFAGGDRVTISRLPLGGYQISMAGNGRSVGARRIK